MKKLLASTALAVTLLMSGCAGADAPDSKAAQNPAPACAPKGKAAARRR